MAKLLSMNHCLAEEKITGMHSHFCQTIHIINRLINLILFDGFHFASNNSIEFYVLPPGSTSTLQPADVYYNRTFKNFIRRASDWIRWKKPEYTLAIRKNILNLLDLVYNQFKSDIFSNFLKYSWFKTGFRTKHPGDFVTPVEYCLNFGDLVDCNSCGNFPFLHCSYCSNHYCFDHAMNHRH